MINRIKVEDKSEQTIKSYERAVDRLIRFHGLIHPKGLDIHEALDFLVSLTEHRKVNWIFLAPRFKARNLKSISKYLKVCPPEVIEYKNIRKILTATTGIFHTYATSFIKVKWSSGLPSACGSLLSMSRMDIDSARAKISQYSKIRGSPYPDPDVKIYTRPIPAYRKVELR